MSLINTLVVSDIHLGSEECQLSKIIEILSTTPCKRLIINGDLVSHDCNKPFTGKEWSVIHLISDAVRRGIEVIWVRGNHDEGCEKLASMMGVKFVRKYKFEINTRRYIAIHGDLFDSWIGDNPWLCKLFFNLYYWVVKVDTTSSVPRWMKRRSNSWLESASRVTRNALKFFSGKRLDFILLGHTHFQSKQISKDFKTAINGGCFCDSSETGYLTIDAHGMPHLHKI